MADVKWAYAASSNLTVSSGLESLATSSSHITGWESAEIDNSTNKYLDYLVSAKFTVGAATAGTIRMHIVPKLDDSTWPGGFDGTGSAETTPLDDENGTAAGAMVAKVIGVDATSGQVYYAAPFSVAALFGGICPEKFTIFITHNTVAAFASSGQQVTIKGVYATVA
jgi:hypothetical protein